MSEAKTRPLGFHPRFKEHLKNDGELTRAFVESFDYSDRIRFGAHSKAKAFIEEAYKRRGLPLVEGFTLFSHQMSAIEFMERSELAPATHGITGGFLLLMMGLGKTLVSVAHSLIRPKGTYPTLIVCPKTVMREWRYECFEQFFNTEGSYAVKVLYLHSDYMRKTDIDELTRDDFTNYDFVVTTYDVISGAYSKDQTPKIDCSVFGEKFANAHTKVQYIQRRNETHALRKNPKGLVSLFYTPWERLICDESHKFASSSTIVYSALMALVSRFTWCMSGTWIRNYSEDIFSQLKVCGYNGNKTLTSWKQHGKSDFHTHNLASRIVNMNYIDANIRIPPHTQRIELCELEGPHMELYQKVRDELLQSIDLFDKGGERWTGVFEKFVRLRQISIAPCVMFYSTKRKSGSALLKWAEDKNGDGGIRAPKLRKVIELITKKIPPNEKYLIFSNYKTALDLTQCAIEAFTTDIVLMINGDVVGQERNAAITEFKNNSDIRGMLLTYGVGSEGINFTCANHVIFLEPWWSHAVHHQAYSRAHRIGQTRHVHTYYIIVKDSIEEVIQEVCNKKIKEIKDFFGDENDISSSKGISVEAIKTIAGVRRA